MKKLLKKKDGFTLVELIVVIAILAILAAVAIPAYSGYIAKAHEAADYQTLDSVKTAATFAAMSKAPEAVVTGISFSAADTFTVTTNPASAAPTQAEVEAYCGDIELNYAITCTWDGTEWKILTHK